MEALGLLKNSSGLFQTRQMINAPSAALPRPPANCPQVLIMVYFFLADFDLVLPDLEGVVLTAPDLGVFGTVGATAGAAAGAGAGAGAGAAFLPPPQV